MGIKLVHNGINGFQKSFEAKLNKVIIAKLTMLGEDLVKYAKENHNYTDQTGNLTNSIGYVVMCGGEIKAGSCLDDNIASNLALLAAIKIANEQPNNYSLIIVAGMNYAAYVEAKGYNVILPAELKAKHDFSKAMEEIQKKISSKFYQVH